MENARRNVKIKMETLGVSLADPEGLIYNFDLRLASNAVFHWQIFSPFFVCMSKNRKKSFYWANIPDGVKPESSF